MRFLCKVTRPGTHVYTNRRRMTSEHWLTSRLLLFSVRSGYCRWLTLLALLAMLALLTLLTLLQVAVDAQGLKEEMARQKQAVTHASIRAHIDTHKHTYTPTHTHTYIQTHTHTHTQICVRRSGCVPELQR
jgi:ABC-type nickel/cobalt efflux system permease component RcnA